MMLMKSTRCQPIEEDRMFHTKNSLKSKIKVELFEERCRNFPGKDAEKHKKTQHNMCTGLVSSQTRHRI